MAQIKQSPLQNLAYINQKCMQAKAAGVFDEVEITCLWNALDAIHHELLIQAFSGDGREFDPLQVHSVLNCLLPNPVANKANCSATDLATGL